MFITILRSEEKQAEGYFKYVKLFSQTLCSLNTLNNLKDSLSQTKAPPPPQAVLDCIQKRPSLINRICSKYY